VPHFSRPLREVEMFSLQKKKATLISVSMALIYASNDSGREKPPAHTLINETRRALPASP